MTLAEGGDINTALVLLDQIRDLLEGTRPTAKASSVWERLNADDDPLR